MKLSFNHLAGVIIAGAVTLSGWAQPAPAHENFNAEQTSHNIAKIEVRNFQDESLGRITDLGIDLVNGRIVEVLIVSDMALNVGGKIVAVPPIGLLPDPINKVYRLNATIEQFKSAPGIDLAHWTDAGRNDRVAAVYQHFPQEPYFLVEGAPAADPKERPKVSLGYVERASKILDLPVGNLNHEAFGTVWNLSMDIPAGKITSVVVLAPGNFKTKSVIPATALRFNEARDALLLDDTKIEYADEPRLIFTEAAYGQPAHTQQESFHGQNPANALEQGNSISDVDTSVRINKEIRAAKINGRNVQVGTVDGRVTLRGWADSSDAKIRIGTIAVTIAGDKLVNNQIMVGKPVTSN